MNFDLEKQTQFDNIYEHLCWSIRDTYQLIFTCDFFCTAAGKESPLILKTLLGLATTYCDMDDTLSAIEVYKKVLVIIEKMRGPMDESLALPLSHLGHCLLEEGRVDEAEFALIR